MTARVMAEQVMQIISTDLTEAQIEAFINSANVLIDSVLLDRDLPAALLTEIELWLSAHFLSMRDQRVKSERVDEYSATFQGETGMGLKATTYGQQALALDYSGTLENLGRSRAVIELV